jgi:hypothetical protein
MANAEVVTPGNDDRAVAMRRPRQFLVALLTVSLLSAGAGVFVAATTPWKSPVEQAVNRVGDRAQADLDYGTNERLEPPSVDPNVEFPEALAELPNPPTHLAVDTKTGDLWFLLFRYDGRTNDLYHYKSSDQTVDKRPIPASTGSEFFSAIAIDSRGHVISAEGDVVLDIFLMESTRNSDCHHPRIMLSSPDGKVLMLLTWPSRMRRLT